MAELQLKIKCPYCGWLIEYPPRKPKSEYAPDPHIKPPKFDTVYEGYMTRKEWKFRKLVEAVRRELVGD